MDADLQEAVAEVAGWLREVGYDPHRLTPQQRSRARRLGIDLLNPGSRSCVWSGGRPSSREERAWRR